MSKTARRTTDVKKLLDGARVDATYAYWLLIVKITPLKLVYKAKVAICGASYYSTITGLYVRVRAGARQKERNM